MSILNSWHIVELSICIQCAKRKHHVKQVLVGTIEKSMLQLSLTVAQLRWDGYTAYGVFVRHMHINY